MLVCILGSLSGLCGLKNISESTRNREGIVIAGSEEGLEGKELEVKTHYTNVQVKWLGG